MRANAPTREEWAFFQSKMFLHSISNNTTTFRVIRITVACHYHISYLCHVPQKDTNDDGFIPPHGGYEQLRSYQKALVVFDATTYFCRRFIDKKDRTYDQMVQAARSGKQNIVEGSQISGTSKELELKLTNVARASFEELLEDYRDFLRGRGLAEWPSEHRYVRCLRELNRTPDANYETFRKGIEHPDPEICANVIVGLIKVTNYLLDQQIRSLEKAFIENGGLREAMTRARLNRRGKGQKGPPR
jgi:four helix bundle suffix protein